MLVAVFQYKTMVQSWVLMDQVEFLGDSGVRQDETNCLRVASELSGSGQGMVRELSGNGHTH